MTSALTCYNRLSASKNVLTLLLVSKAPQVASAERPGRKSMSLCKSEDAIRSRRWHFALISFSATQRAFFRPLWSSKAKLKGAKLCAPRITPPLSGGGTSLLLSLMQPGRWRLHPRSLKGSPREVHTATFRLPAAPDNPVHTTLMHTTSHQM